MIHSTAIQWWMLLAVLPALFLVYVGFSLVLRFRWLFVIGLVVSMFCGVVLLLAARHRIVVSRHIRAEHARHATEISRIKLTMPMPPMHALPPRMVGLTPTNADLQIEISDAPIGIKTEMSNQRADISKLKSKNSYSEISALASEDTGSVSHAAWQESEAETAADASSPPVDNVESAPAGNSESESPAESETSSESPTADVEVADTAETKEATAAWATDSGSPDAETNATIDETPTPADVAAAAEASQTAANGEPTIHRSESTDITAEALPAAVPLSTADPPADSAAPPASAPPEVRQSPLPDWVVNPPDRVDGQLAMVLVSDPFETSLECDRNIEDRIRAAISLFADEVCRRHNLSIHMLVPITEDDIRAVKRDRYSTMRSTSMGDMRQVHQLIVFDDAIQTSIDERVQQASVWQTLGVTGGMSGAALATVTAAFGLFRFLARKSPDPLKLG